LWPPRGERDRREKAQKTQKPDPAEALPFCAFCLFAASDFPVRCGRSLRFLPGESIQRKGPAERAGEEVTASRCRGFGVRVVRWFAVDALERSSEANRGQRGTRERPSLGLLRALLQCVRTAHGGQDSPAAKWGSASPIQGGGQIRRREDKGMEDKGVQGRALFRCPHSVRDRADAARRPA
jgi:hypothetical protein